MDEFLHFYKQTWWFWLLMVIASVILARTVLGVFYLLIPILLAYSVYFAYVRGSEIRAKKEELEQARLDEQRK